MKKIIFSTILACLFFFNAQAQEEETTDDDYSKWQVRARAVAVSPAPYFYDAISGFDVEISTTFAPELDITYFLSKNIAFELMVTSSKHDVELNDGTRLGSVSLIPPTLSLQYHAYLNDFKPYIGAGMSYVIFNGTAAGDLDSIDYENAVGYTLQIGIDYNLSEKWFLNLDFKKMFLNTDVTANNDSTNTAEVNIDPLFLGFGVGMKF
ncbi:OmpW/AlkL family protein [Psychroserpens sp.]|uniref:OmpW/AlkL family protein n=1 Tax=Psychroserpens sp. TaxID=2020870 RepID=UPI002B27769A|nr:OmpW family outer membrane protein [Psychroserpens sp.]